MEDECSVSSSSYGQNQQKVNDNDHIKPQKLSN